MVELVNHKWVIDLFQCVHLFFSSFLTDYNCLLGLSCHEGSLWISRAGCVSMCEYTVMCLKSVWGFPQNYFIDMVCFTVKSNVI